jgi:hypothetical protein
MKRTTAILCSLALAGAIAATSVTHAAAFAPEPTSTLQQSASTPTSVPLTGIAVALATAQLVFAVLLMPEGDRYPDLQLDPSRATWPAGFEDRVFDR